MVPTVCLCVNPQLGGGDRPAVSVPLAAIFLGPDAAAEEAGAAELDFVLLFLEHFLRLIIIRITRRQVAKYFQNSVTNRKGGQVDVF